MYFSLEMMMMKFNQLFKNSSLSMKQYFSGQPTNNTQMNVSKI